VRNRTRAPVRARVQRPRDWMVARPFRSSATALCGRPVFVRAVFVLAYCGSHAILVLPANSMKHLLVFFQQKRDLGSSRKHSFTMSIMPGMSKADSANSH